MITLHKGQYLSDVMSEIPSNCILSKRIPGCGATTLELVFITIEQPKLIRNIRV